jgi:hypothetical protein
MSARVDQQARKRIQAREERAVRRDREIAELSLTVSRLKATAEAIRPSSPSLRRPYPRTYRLAKTASGPLCRGAACLARRS